ncbi:response regulator [Rubritalea spongiae]|uniref:Response regulator n=1 Tax=Rubritalea spongiae TaxID=430797 RepID=A0ABW5E0S2_9BACT
MHDDQPQPLMMADQLTEASHKKHRILIVDDEPTLRIGLEVALEDDDRDIVSVSSGSEALELLKEESFNLIVLDLNMPDVTGLDVLNELRKRGDMTRVMVCSAHVTDRAVLSAVRNGVVDFLAKPISLQQLRDFVDTLLGSAKTYESGLEEAFKYARQLKFREAASIIKQHMDDSKVPPHSKHWMCLFKVLATYPRSAHDLGMDAAGAIAQNAWVDKSL